VGSIRYAEVPQTTQQPSGVPHDDPKPSYPIQAWSNRRLPLRRAVEARDCAAIGPKSRRGPRTSRSALSADKVIITRDMKLRELLLQFPHGAELATRICCINPDDDPPEVIESL